MNIYIYGAKSIALGICRAMQTLYPRYGIEGFIVTSADGNPETLAGLPVREICDITDKEAHILIATPEDVHEDIISSLEEAGLYNYTCIDSQIESELMKKYYASEKIFTSLCDYRNKKELTVFAAKFYKDKKLKGNIRMPDWVIPLQVGAALTDVRVAELSDDTGDNISHKNANYCELTALYWIWKNCEARYCGLFHYRRMLDVKDGDISWIKENDVDVILPHPMLHEPDITEHHTRYIKESDWGAMLQALDELHPTYAEAMPEIFKKPYLYNYNLIIAKKDVLNDYCNWLFPILERVEEITDPEGIRADRYIGYLGENLLTLYFMYHQKDLKIVHTGRLMLT